MSRARYIGIECEWTEKDMVAFPHLTKKTFVVPIDTDNIKDECDFHFAIAVEIYKKFHVVVGEEGIRHIIKGGYDSLFPKYKYGDILLNGRGEAIVVMNVLSLTKTYECEEQKGEEDDYLCLPFEVCHGKYRKVGEITKDAEPHWNFRR